MLLHKKWQCICAHRTKCIIMKKMILPAVCILMIASTASAQTRNSRRRGREISSTVTTSSVANEAKNPTIAQPLSDNRRASRQTLITVIPDNRKEFMQDGQLATYTGHQATAINTDEFQSARKSDAKNEGESDDKKE